MTLRALDVLGCRLDAGALIEASAGTGKTWAICALVLRLLLERGLAVSRILVLTFTNAATAELRERIRSRIAQTLARLRGRGPADEFIDALLARLRGEHGLADDEIGRRLEDALHGFDEAAIHTIHGFCLRALTDSALATGMPYGQELLRDQRELRLEGVNDFWRREVAAAPIAPALAAHLLGRGDCPERWEPLLARALARPLSRLIWPEDLDDPEPLDSAGLEAAHRAAAATWSAERARILAIVEEALPRLPATSYKPRRVAAAAREWDELLAVEHPWAASGKLETADLLSATRLVPNKGKAPPAPHPFFAQAALLLELRAAAQPALARARLRLLRRLLEVAPAQARARARSERVIAFDQMLHALHERLAGADGAALAALLRERYAAVLVDEFQDTDPLQAAIFERLAAGAQAHLPLFYVGDPKQAIYSFRNADLHAYLRARERAGARWALLDNQRAAAPLLDALNALFTANPRAFVLPGLDYQPLRLGAKPRPAWEDRSGAARAALQLWALPDGDDGRPLAKADALGAAAAACAGEIARLIAAGQRGEIRHAGRALEGGDIAVLVRSHRHGARMRDALAALGVASVELSQASVYDSPDAEGLERVLRAVQEPARARRLRAALATDLLGFDAGAIDALGDDDAGVDAIAARLADYRQRWLADGIGAMLRALIHGEGVAARLLARADGERRMTNLLHLAECLQQAETDHPEPEALLRWPQAQRGTRSADEAAQLRLESDRHLVQVVTIHRAKGLEYPLVFCPLLWDAAAGAAASIEGREYHDDHGEPVIDFRPDLDPALEERIAGERLAEDLRLIYVALTRAVQRCTVVVGPYRSGRSDKPSCRSPLNWLVADHASGTGDQDPPAMAATPAEVRAAWAHFAAACPSASLDPLPAGPWTALAAARAAPDEIAALDPPALIPPAWRIGSYSSLTLGARHEGAAVDHDARAAAPAGSADASEPALAPDDILRFPRSAEAGSCLHAVFERIDFADPAGWPAVIDEALRLRPPARPGGADAGQLAAMIRRMLADVLHTPLPGGLKLAEVPRARRLIELEFHLPAAHLDATALSALLRAHGCAAPDWTFGTLRGWLTGFIDLVVEHRGRWVLIDWKSNHLGTQPSDYGAPALARAIDANGYTLQYLLYTVALHRLLALRLPDYDYERHFGGVAYLFVRGVRPHWRGDDGHSAGVYSARPPRALIERLSALLGQGAAP